MDRHLALITALRNATPGPGVAQNADVGFWRETGADSRRMPCPGADSGFVRQMILPGSSGEGRLGWKEDPAHLSRLLPRFLYSPGAASGHPGRTRRSAPDLHFESNLRVLGAREQRKLARIATALQDIHRELPELIIVFEGYSEDWFRPHDTEKMALEPQCAAGVAAWTAMMGPVDSSPSGQLPALGTCRAGAVPLGAGSARRLKLQGIRKGNKLARIVATGKRAWCFEDGVKHDHADIE